MAEVARRRPMRPTRPPPPPPIATPIVAPENHLDDDSLEEVLGNLFQDENEPIEPGSIVNGQALPLNITDINSRLSALQEQAREAMENSSENEATLVSFERPDGSIAYRPASWVLNWKPEFDTDLKGSDEETRSVLADHILNPKVFNYRLPTKNNIAKLEASGRFFNGLLTTVAEEALLRFGIDLDIDQVWSESSIINNLGYKPHCFWNCLRMTTRDEGRSLAAECDINELCKGNIKINLLNKVSSHYKRVITVSHIDCNGEAKYSHYGKRKGYDDSKNIHLVLYRGHYMVNRLFETHYNGKPLTIRKAIREKALGTENEATPARKGNPKINTFQLLRLLDAHGYIVDIPTDIKILLPSISVPGFKLSEAFTREMFTPDPKDLWDDLDEFKSKPGRAPTKEEFDKLREKQERIRAEQKPPSVWYGDFETTTDENDVHVSYLGAAISRGGSDIITVASAENIRSVGTPKHNSILLGQKLLRKICRRVHENNELEEHNLKVNDNLKVKINKTSVLIDPELSAHPVDDPELSAHHHDSSSRQDPEDPVDDPQDHHDPDDPADQGHDDPELSADPSGHDDPDDPADQGHHRKKPKPQQVIIYFHNLRYDANFILGALERISSVESGSRLFQAKGYFYLWHWKDGKMIGSTIFEVILKDSWAYLQCKLKDFTKMFNLEEGKDTEFEYSCMNTNTLKSYTYLPTTSTRGTVAPQGDSDSSSPNSCRSLDHDDPVDHPQDRGEEWIEKIPSKYICKRTGRVSIYEYATDYCIQDCKVLQQGFDIFVKDCSDKLGLNVDDSITIAGLAHKFMFETGCLEDVEPLRKCVREYVQQSVIGGRVMTRNNTTNEYDDSKSHEDRA